MRCCWAATVGCVLITVPIALCPHGRRTIRFCVLELSHNAPAGVRAYAMGPVASGGSFHLRYDGAVSVTQSDEPQLLAFNLVRSNGSQALTGHYLVDMLPQPGVPSVKEHTLSPLSDRSFPTLGWRVFEPGDIVIVVPASLMCVPVDAMQRNSRLLDLSSGPRVVDPIPVVAASFTCGRYPLALACPAPSFDPGTTLVER